MSTDRPTRVIFADQLTAGDVILDTYPKPQDLVVLDVRVVGDLTSFIMMDEDGEQRAGSYLNHIGVRILARDTAPAEPAAPAPDAGD